MRLAARATAGADFATLQCSTLSPVYSLTNPMQMSHIWEWLQVIRINFNHDAMKKIGIRLMKKYEVPAEVCPNISKSQSLAFAR